MTFNDPRTLSARGVSKNFGEVHALREVSIDIPAGQSVSVMGPSGSGKSTLLHCLAGILMPDAGDVSLGDEPVSLSSDAARSRLRLERMGFVFQDGQLLPELPALENVALPAAAAGPAEGRGSREGGGLAGSTGPWRARAAPSGQLSGGQAHRVAIARAMVGSPAVVLADEPTGALDQATGAEVMRVLTATAKGAGASLVVVTHDLTVARWCERHVEIVDGRVLDRRGSRRRRDDPGHARRPAAPARADLYGPRRHRRPRDRGLHPEQLAAAGRARRREHVLPASAGAADRLPGRPWAPGPPTGCSSCPFWTRARRLRGCPADRARHDAGCRGSTHGGAGPGPAAGNAQAARCHRRPGGGTQRAGDDAGRAGRGRGRDPSATWSTLPLWSAISFQATPLTANGDAAAADGHCRDRPAAGHPCGAQLDDRADAPADLAARGRPTPAPSGVEGVALPRPACGRRCLGTWSRRCCTCSGSSSSARRSSLIALGLFMGVINLVGPWLLQLLGVVLSRSGRPARPDRWTAAPGRSQGRRGGRCPGSPSSASPAEHWPPCRRSAATRWTRWC